MQYICNECFLHADIYTANLMSCLLRKENKILMKINFSYKGLKLKSSNNYNYYTLFICAISFKWMPIPVQDLGKWSVNDVWRMYGVFSRTHESLKFSKNPSFMNEHKAEFLIQLIIS